MRLKVSNGQVKLVAKNIKSVLLLLTFGSMCLIVKNFIQNIDIEDFCHIPSLFNKSCEGNS